MLDRLLARGAKLAEAQRERVIARLLQQDLPRGVRVERKDEGIVLSGRRLLRRLITDNRIRRFGR